jgi:hypothetical protein
MSFLEKRREKVWRSTGCYFCPCFLEKGDGGSVCRRVRVVIHCWVPSSFESPQQKFHFTIHFIIITFHLSQTRVGVESYS